MATAEISITPEMIAEAVRKAMESLAETNGTATTPTKPTTGKLDAKKDYPLGQKRPDLVRSATGLSIDEITLEKAASGKLTFDDVRIRPETLEYQAQIAESAGRPHLAKNLRRAAEMTRIPDARVLEIYNALRPYRSTKQELLDIASELENKYQAKICAGFVREATQVYEKRNRIKK
jgi:propanediol dehydratase small subunit